jgi:hypothetical protein
MKGEIELSPDGILETDGSLFLFRSSSQRKSRAIGGRRYSIRIEQAAEQCMQILISRSDGSLA